MFTQCPECGTVFRVTATVLRAARGQVRCGVCDATFDALQYLMEEFEADADGVAARDAGSRPSTADTAEHEALVVADDGGPADAAAEEELEQEDEDDLEDGPPPEPVDAEAEEALLEAAARFEDPRAPVGNEFPLEELDEPIDVIDRPDAGPEPEFPPFAAEADEELGRRAAGDGTPTATTTTSEDTGELPGTALRPEAARAPDEGDDVGTASPEDDSRTTASDGVFAHRAGRNTPSADEDRALAEIAAAIARGSPPRFDDSTDTTDGANDDAALVAATPSAEHEHAPTADAPTDALPVATREGAIDDAAPPLTDRDHAAVADTRPAGAGDTFVDDDAPSLEIDLLDPSDAENIVLTEDDDAAETDAKVRLLAASGGADIPDSALEFDLPADEWDRVFVPDAAAAPLQPTQVRSAATGITPPRPSAPVGTDVEFDYEDDDGDLDEEDLAERGLRANGTPAGAPTPAVAAEPHEDPLSRTDEFPPLRVTLAEEAAAGLADTPAARPRQPGVSPEDFDALVAAAATRAAAEVAARVGAAPAAAPTIATEPIRGSSEPLAANEPVIATEPLREPIAAPADGRAEAAWFDARRDLAREGAQIAHAESPETIQFDAERFHAIASEHGRRAWWATGLLVLGALALTLGLAAQAAHYWRDALAQHPIVGPPLREAYTRLGLPLEPLWNLGAYDVKQWGATSDATPGVLRVRASIVNRAPRGQPHPLLRVTLLDRFSAKVARREFTPAEYLPGRSAPAALFAAGARVDADLQIADPGSEAVGFELDVCLPQRGVLVCATDQRLAVP